MYHSEQGDNSGESKTHIAASEEATMPEQERKSRHKPNKLSLYPLKFEEALADILQVKPQPKEERQVPTKKEESKQ